MKTMEKKRPMTKGNDTDSFLSSIWRLLISIRLTVILLLILAATSVIGTLIPQGASPADYIMRYGEIVYRLLYAFDLLDMYHSWFFRLLIGLLAVNIIACTVKRFPGIWKIVFSDKINIPSVRPGKGYSAEFKDARDPDKLKSVYEIYISKRYYRYRSESNANGFLIVAEKGRWTRLGVTAVHLSILILLVGALLGSLFGFDGYVNIAEGESADRIQLRNSNMSMPLGFELVCEDFEVSFYNSGTPKEYKSRLHIVEDGKTVTSKDIIVNDPLRYNGINFFQSSYGNIPPRELTLNFTHRETGEMTRRKISVGRRVEIPGSDLRIYLREIANNYQIQNVDAGPTVLGVVDRPGEKPTELVLPIRFPSFDKTRNGEYTIAVGSYDQLYYTGLQVTYDPGILLVYAGFILLILGCYVSFFMTHDKVFMEVAQNTHGCIVRVYGTSSRISVGFENRMQKFSADLGWKK